jgi:FlgN protein.
MSKHIYSNMHRQFKSFELLLSLLEEEYGLLGERNIEAVTTLEFSIHELLRQLAVERIALKAELHGTKLLEYADMLPDEEADELRKLFWLVDSLEQRASRQASLNAEFSLVLMDQSQTLLTFLHDQITPRHTVTYGAGGRLRETRPGATLFSGRM